MENVGASKVLVIYIYRLARGTKIVVLVEAILGEEKPYPRPIRSEADF